MSYVFNTLAAVAFGCLVYCNLLIWPWLGERGATLMSVLCTTGSLTLFLWAGIMAENAKSRTVWAKARKMAARARQKSN